MLLRLCRRGAPFPKLDNLIPFGTMKILLVYLGLLGNAVAMPMPMPQMPMPQMPMPQMPMPQMPMPHMQMPHMQMPPMHMPRMPTSKSEEMSRYNQFNFMNSPHMAHLGPPYGNGMQMPPVMPPYQMPMWPQPPPNTKQPKKPVSPKRPSKIDPTPETPTQTQPKKSTPPKQHLKQPSPTPTQPQEEEQTPQAFPAFGNGLYPYHQPPWPVPQRMPPGFGRPISSNEDGGNPYFGYFGYHGFGGRPPYYSEEMFEQDFEKPKEKDPPKNETPATEPSPNSTVPETNATQPIAPNPRGNQPGNDTNAAGNGGPGSNPVNNPTAQNPSPTVNISGQGIPRSQPPLGRRHPNFPGNYPNPNFRNYPAGRQWRPTGTVLGHRPTWPYYRNQQVQGLPRWHSFTLENKQAIRPGTPFYRKAYASTARGNSPNQAGNPTNFKRKPQSPNKQPIGTSVAPLPPKRDPVGQNEKIQNPRESSLGQKEKVVTPTRGPAGAWRNSQDYGANKSNFKPPPPESNMPVPSFNSIDQRENTYYPRGDSRKAPNSDGQAPTQSLPKGIILEPKRIPYESEPNSPGLRQSTYPPIYPEEIPSPAREHFPAGRNTWNHQEISPPFKEDPRRQEGHLPHPSQGSRGGVYYPDYNPYDPRENTPYLRRNTWDERDDSPNAIGQPENTLYPMNTPDPKETIPYNEEDPTDPTGDEIYQGQGRWGMEESRFKGGPTIRHYEGEQYSPNQPKDYLPNPVNNPSKPREEFPYSEFYPWNPDETFPSYNAAPSVTPPVESRGYYANNAIIGQEERPPFPSWNSWGNRIQSQGQKERGPYFNRNFWDQSVNVYKTPTSLPHQKENQPYSNNYPAGLQRNPGWNEGENLNYGMQNIRLNLPERERSSFPDLITSNNPAGQKEPHSFHQNHRGPCCVGESTGLKDNPLALQDYTPSFDLAPGENQDTSPVYTEDNHTKHARHTISPTSSLPGQRNSSEKRLPTESQNPSPFRDDVPTPRRNTPCSIKNQLAQRGIMPFPETNSLQSKNLPCLKNNLGGDGNNHALEQIFEDNQLNERTVGLTPEQLVITTAEEDPKPEGIEGEVQVKDSEPQPPRLPTILQLPCFDSRLTKYHSSNTGTPSSTGRQGSFDEDPVTPTEIPSSLAGLATGEHFQGINVDLRNAGENPPFDSLQIGTIPQDQVQDCLLLQA